jgi:hypothetical protein
MLVLNSNSLTWVWKKVSKNAIGKKLENCAKMEKLKIRVVLKGIKISYVLRMSPDKKQSFLI